MDAVLGATSTADEVLAGVDLRGKRILVTGVSAGLGAETARVLVAHGAEVVGTARNLKKAGIVADAATSDTAGGERLTVAELDLASLASIDTCAGALLSEGRPFDLIVANAGVMGCGRGTTRDGFETHFGTNHLGHFLFVNRLASLLRPGSRVVSLSSWGHNYADVDLDDPNFERTAYEPLVAYGRSKTANVLFAVEFDRRHQGEGIRATAVHPGGIHTELYRYFDENTVNHLTSVPEGGDRAILGKTVSQGVAPVVWAGLVAPADTVGGRYCEDCRVSEVIAAEAPEGVRAYAVDPDRARALWAKSEAMVGERF